jgi:hypothetical protein
VASLPRDLGIGYAGVACPHCQHPLDHATLRSGPQSCPGCRRPFEALRFDPPERESRAASVAEAGPGGSTACAQHRGNVAVANCERCGVFMCALCRIDSDSLALCPGCFDRLSAEGQLESARVSYRDYGRMASTMALVGIVVIFVGILAGPAAVYYGMKSLRQKREMGETDGRAGVWLAIVLGALEAVGWLVVVALMVKGG